MSAGTAARSGWVLGPGRDFAIFSGPILVSGLLILAAHLAGVLYMPLSPWLFLVLVVGCDVSHVYATVYRSYLDPAEMAQRGQRYLLVPLGCLVAGMVLYSWGPLVFWRCLAYLAVWHFVRQQWGWMALSRRAAGETDAVGRRLDQFAIYNATVFPLLWWHASLPREFTWFLADDFVTLIPRGAADTGMVLHWALNALYLGHLAVRWWRGLGFNLAKLQIWITTWIAWYGGIVLLNSDLAFTALNVLSHGVPYLAVVYSMERERWTGGGRFSRWLQRGAWLAFFLPLLLAGIAEEWAWDRLRWHEHPGLFPGPSLALDPAWLVLIVPLLSVPQAAHYVMDGWLWRRRGNPRVGSLVREPAAPAVSPGASVPG